MTKTRTAYTLIEVLVSLAILATLVAMLAPAFFAARDAARLRNGQAEAEKPPMSIWLSTVQHDGHWFVTRPEGPFLHHPDCPCRTKTAEAQ